MFYIFYQKRKRQLKYRQLKREEKIVVVARQLLIMLFFFLDFVVFVTVQHFESVMISNSTYIFTLLRKSMD